MFAISDAAGKKSNHLKYVKVLVTHEYGSLFSPDVVGIFSVH